MRSVSCSTVVVMLLSISSLSARTVEILDLSGRQRASVFTSPSEYAADTSSSVGKPAPRLYTPRSPIQSCGSYKVARAGSVGGKEAAEPACLGCYVILEWVLSCPTFTCELKVCVATGALKRIGCLGQKVVQEDCEPGCDLTDGICPNPDCGH